MVLSKKFRINFCSKKLWLDFFENLYIIRHATHKYSVSILTNFFAPLTANQRKKIIVSLLPGAESKSSLSVAKTDRAADFEIS